ncbi:MAG TPA: ATP12 family protein [Rhizomicrobium sp.]|jgi:chaperone required for assembly of F1-ATPase|nr:ATP12 family protein [Rhizomicrobium sp.]
MKQTKRFYTDAVVAERQDGYVILLDGRPVKTLQRAVLNVLTQALANAIATEWREQGEHVERSAMPLTGLANSAIDRVGSNRGQLIDHILAFGRSDLVCYRASEPARLAERQKDVWDPLLQWAWTAHGLRLMADAGISYIEQPVDAIVRMQELVSSLGDFTLAALDLSASLTGSFVIALALVGFHITAEEAFAAAQLDEIFQAETWGSDAEAEAKRTRVLKELRAVERFAALTGERSEPAAS